MNYFINEDERKVSDSTCYHEFAKGKWDSEACIFWKEDSLNIHDDIMYSLKLGKLISKFVDNYEPYGETEVTKEQWDAIYERAKEIGGELFEAVSELVPWTEENFTEHEVFTIIGI